MRSFYLYASTYESVELMHRHYESDHALELRTSRVSAPFYVLAESPQDAAKQFQESPQYEAFSSQNVGKSVYIYHRNDTDCLVRVDI